jgi:hypothetical protein
VKEMKKYLVCSVVLLFLLSFSASATMITSPVTIGVGGMYPDITIDGNGQIVFDSQGGAGSGGQLKFTANDLQITYSSTPGDVEFLAGLVDFELVVNIDGAGTITTGSMMTETAIADFTLYKPVGAPHNYFMGETVLSGPVVKMQWDNTAGNGRYGFQINPVSGEFVNDFWPDVAMNIFGYSETHTWPGPDWWNGDDFTLDKCKANKAAVPEPSTLLLLGFGLVGVAGYAWRRKKKQS